MAKQKLSTTALTTLVGAVVIVRSRMPRSLRTVFRASNYVLHQDELRLDSTELDLAFSTILKEEAELVHAEIDSGIAVYDIRLNAIVSSNTDGSGTSAFARQDILEIACTTSGIRELLVEERVSAWYNLVDANDHTLTNFYISADDCRSVDI